MLTKKFWWDTFERACKTFAQTAAGFLTGNGLGVLDVNWKQIISVSGLAAVASLLTSVASSQVGDETDASLVK